MISLDLTASEDRLLFRALTEVLASGNFSYPEQRLLEDIQDRLTDPDE